MSVKNNLFIAFLVIAFALNAQVNDAKLWFKATVEKKITPKLSAAVAASTRIGENISTLETYYVSAEASYKIKKWVRLGVKYRYSGKKEIEPYFMPRNRFNVDLTFKKKFFRKVVLEPRFRYQRQYTQYYTSEKGTIPNDYVRFKTTASLDLHKRYVPFVSAELYYRLKYDREGFNRVRYALGVSYEINKYHKISLYYMLQKEFNRVDPESAYILGLSYKFTF